MVLSPSSASMKKLSIDTEGASRLRRDGLAQLLAEQVRPLIRRERHSLPEIGRRDLRRRRCDDTLDRRPQTDLVRPSLDARKLCNADVQVSNLLYPRSEEHTSEPQSLMRISYAGF